MNKAENLEKFIGQNDDSPFEAVLTEVAVEGEA
jgi:hypothetical protein